MSTPQALFWAVLGALTLLALAFVLWPLLRIRPVSDISRKHLNVAIYRERLRSDAGGFLDADEAAQRLVQDVAGEPPAARVATTPVRWPWVLGVVLALPLLALGLYLPADSWRLVGSSQQRPPLDYLLIQLQERAAAAPQNFEAHLMLARAYRAVERYAEAAAAYAQANRLSAAPDPDALAEEAEVRVLLARGDFRGTPLELFTRALDANPQHQKSLWYMGLIAYQAQDHTQALEYWQRLARQTLPEDFRLLLAQKITELGATPEPPAAAGVSLPLRVSLDPKLAASLPKEAVVFVFARAPEDGGMPLAVLRRPAAELPFTVALTDELNMAGGPRLSAFDRWRVVARVSRSGEPLPKSGDWFAERVVSRAELQQGAIELVINQVQP